MIRGAFRVRLRGTVRLENCLAIFVLLCALPAIAQLPAPSDAPSSDTSLTSASPGRIRGTVVDKDGAVIANVKVSLTLIGISSTPETSTDGNGNFVFIGVNPGAFEVSFVASGFAHQRTSGFLHPGEDQLIPQVALAVERAEEDIDVRVTPVEVAEDQIRVEEKQRLLGVIPNFYVTYDAHPVPLSSGQKFRLAWKTTIDPVSVGITAIIAGFEQANNTFRDYGQGAQGYGKRFGAAYADFVSGTIIGAAILPSVLKQDPRYYYKGTGSVPSRTLYAVANAVICKGDNGRWQPNYSNVLGDLASAGLSNLYYPAADRNGPKLTMENAAIGIASTALANIAEEFLLRKITPHAREQPSAKP
jgi:Carboxypeptidase regulatory-like domain